MVARVGGEPDAVAGVIEAGVHGKHAEYQHVAGLEIARQPTPAECGAQLGRVVREPPAIADVAATSHARVGVTHFVGAKLVHVFGAVAFVEAGVLV